MADHFKEEIVTKKKKGLSMLIYIVMWISMLFSALVASVQLMAIMNGSFSVPGIIVFLIFGGGAVLGWWGKDYLRVEYEYTFTNGVVDIAQVINNRRRKEALSFKMKDVEIVASIDNAKLHNYEQKQNIKKIKAVVNVDTDVYFIFTKKNDQYYLIYMEPSAEFLKLMRMYNDRNVFL